MTRPDAWLPEEELALGGTGFLAALLLLVFVGLLLPKERRASVRVPLISTVGFIAFESLRLALPEGPWTKPLRVLAVFFLLFAAGRGVFLLLFESRVSGRLNASLPKIFRDIIQVIIYVGVLLATLRVAGADPGSLLTTSALITAVIGLSLQETLGNLFAGLALEAQRPFEVGDWVMFDGDVNSVGQVIEMNWRATKVVSLDSIEVMIPNSTIAKAALRNFTKPTPLIRRTVRVGVAYDVAPERAKQALLAALDGIPQVLSRPAPNVVLVDFADSRITYALRYFTDDYRQAELTDSLVRERIWYVFERLNITIPFPQHDVQLRQIDAESQHRESLRHVDERELALRKVDLFDLLSPEERRQLAEQTQTQLFTPGETILRAGEAGSELYLILRGEVAIFAGQDDRSAGEVARLDAGKFFGEMSLMTGQKRNATARAVSECELLVVGHKPFKRLLDARPELVERLSLMLAQRQIALEATSRDSLRTRASQEEQTSKQILERVREFFSIPR